MAAMANVSEGISGALEAVKSWPQQVKTYVEGLRMEMRRVTWPPGKQVRATTGVVLITVFLFGFYFAIVDGILNYAVDRLLVYFTR